MCKVKSGTNIKNESNLQSLVIGIILRQKNKYVEQDIFDAVAYHSREAMMTIDTWIIKDIVRDNLNFLQRTNKLTCMDGIYTPLTIDQY